MYVHSQTHTHAHTYTHTHHRHHSAVEHAQILLPIAEEVPLSVAIRWVDRELMDPALITEEEEELGVEEARGGRGDRLDRDCGDEKKEPGHES